MRSMILMGCLWMLSIATNAQTTTHGRVPSGTPLKFGMQGGIEILPGDLSYYHSNRADTNTAHQRNIKAPGALGGNPNATRFSAINAQCGGNNALLLNWVAVQQFDAYNYEIEQSSDRRNWTVAGVVPANRTEFGQANYSFNYNRGVSNVWFRITATNVAGEKIYSSIIESPCDNNSFIGLTQNPVYSSTTVKLGAPAAAKVRLALMDSHGAVVYTADANIQQGLNYLPIDMSRYARGNYALVIRWFNGRQEVLQLAKQ